MLIYGLSGFSQFASKNSVLPQTILLTHGRCMDGITCAILTRKIWPHAICVLSSHGVINALFSRVVAFLPPKANLLISDISCSKDTLLTAIPLLQQKNISVSIFDHHQTNNWLRNIDLQSFNIPGTIVFSTESCGAKITYDHFVPQFPQLLSPYSQLIEIVNDRDLWLRKHKDSTAFAYLHTIYGDEDFCNRFFVNPSVQFLEKESILIDFYQKQQKKLFFQLLESIQIKTDLQDFQYGVIYGEGDSSELLNEAIKKFNLEYALLVNLHRRSVSVRGRGIFDCALYAEQFGGGGHKKASGFALQNFSPPSF